MGLVLSLALLYVRRAWTAVLNLARHASSTSS